jgi:hypothetical protein
MYFPTSTHYLDDSYEYNEDTEESQYNDCLICLEINDKSNNICIKLHNLYYIKSCSCDGWIHQYCLDFWYVKNKKCPICLCNMNMNMNMNKNNTETVVENINTCNIIFNRDNLYLLIKFSLIICFFCNLIYIFVKILHVL